MISVTDVRNILKNQKPTSWSLNFPPALLASLSQDCHEAILDALPQCGAIAQRQKGALRVLSMGFNVHVGGTDPRVPYPIDFCVRVNGEQAGVNLLIRPDPKKFRIEILKDITLGNNTDLQFALSYLKRMGFESLSDFEILFLKTYRPSCPGALQWGTAGGVFEVGDTAESVSIRETKDEFKGFTYLAWSPLLPQQLYQSGNIFELQTVGAVLGYMPDHTKVETELEEGISDWKAIRLDGAQAFLERINEQPWKDQGIWTDGKLHHGLYALLDVMKSAGIN